MTTGTAFESLLLEFPFNEIGAAISGAGAESPEIMSDFSVNFPID